MMPPQTAQAGPQQTPARRMRQHAMAGHRNDPVSLARRKPLLSARNLVLFPLIGGFALYATGHLEGLDKLFDHVQNFGRDHNDFVVRNLLRVLPAGLVITACAGLGWLAVGAVRRTRRGWGGSAVDQKTLKAAMDNVLRASEQQSSLETAEQLAARTTPSRRKVVRKPGAVPVVHREDDLEAARLRRDALAAANARAVAVGRAAVAHRAPFDRRSLSDSMQTLPFNARVRRPSRPGNLPPQVAAALKAATTTIPLQ